MSSSNGAAFDDPDAPRALRRPRRRLRRQRPARPDRRRSAREIGKEDVTRAIAESAYRHGAKFVDVAYFDLYVKRARHRVRRRRHARLRAAVVRRAHPRARRPARRAHRADRARRTRACSSDLDPRRVGRDQLPAVREIGQGRQRAHDQLDRGAVPDAPVGASSCIPTSTPTRPGSSSASRSCTSAAWTTTTRSPRGASAPTTLVGAAERLTERRFDALHFVGPGTDLTVGLLPSSKFLAARFETVDGIVHLPNLPSEEIFTTPDPPRAEGVVRATKPLVLGGAIIRGLRGRVPRGPRGADRRRRGRRRPALLRRARRGRRPPRRGRARRPRRPHRRARHRLLRHAARRERREPHRARATPTRCASTTRPTPGASTTRRSTSTS